jgi:formate hydrogenlyase subunit 4
LFNVQWDKDNSNSVSISFTVHKSGTYKIHVMVNGKHIKGSPFIKAFEAGNSREVLVMFSVTPPFKISKKIISLKKSKTNPDSLQVGCNSPTSFKQQNEM